MKSDLTQNQILLACRPASRSRVVYNQFVRTECAAHGLRNPPRPRIAEGHRIRRPLRTACNIKKRQHGHLQGFCSLEQFTKKMMINDCILISSSTHREAHYPSSCRQHLSLYNSMPVFLKSHVSPQPNRRLASCSCRHHKLDLASLIHTFKAQLLLDLQSFHTGFVTH